MRRQETLERKVQWLEDLGNDLKASVAGAVARKLELEAGIELGFIGIKLKTMCFTSVSISIQPIREDIGCGNT